MSHVPVMLEEVLAALAPGPGVHIVDGTFGGGGYTGALLEAGATVTGLDRDTGAVARGRQLEDALPGRFRMVETSFSGLDLAVSAPVQGVVLDIGVSSFQIDEAGRGFSFMRDGPLDMRMGPSGPSAADAIAQLTEAELADVFFAYGEERESRRIARAIVADRVAQPFTGTLQLAELVARVAGGGRTKPGTIHPATRVFQALRVFINDELNELHCALGAAERVLAEGGRLVVVTFHSLEDRIVKEFLSARSGTVTGSRHAPAATGPAATFALGHRKMTAAREAEAQVNPRARSAKLRSAVRTGEPPWPLAQFTARGVPSLDDLQRRMSRSVRAERQA
jgi:16S rRNA (cytosine1402-N4)-methyltransferase